MSAKKSEAPGKGIPWGALKSTAPGESGTFGKGPGTFENLEATPMRSEQVLVFEHGETWRVIRTGKNKSGWTQPHPI